ncbi:MAG: TldD/PmbA family protein [Promethearchaeia archaeon]
MDNGKDLADFVIDLGSSQGAEYIEARFIDSTEESYTARNGMFLGILNNQKKGIGIRALVEGGIGFGSTEKLTKNSVKKLVNETISMAKATNPKDPIQLSTESPIQDSWETKAKRGFDAVTREEKQAFMKELDKQLKKAGNRKLKNRIAFMLLYQEDKYFVTNEGAQIDSRHNLITMTLMNTAKGKGGSEQRLFSMGGAAGWEWLDNINFIDLAAEDCKNVIKAAQKAQAMKFNDPIDIVVSGEVSGIMAHENVGHPSEGDRILGREGAQAGESFYADILDEKELGEAKIGNEEVSIIDDPTIPRSPGFYVFDDEGIKTRKRYLIKEGVLNELLLNREYAARFNTKSTAAARALSFNREPIPRMANTFFERGNFTKEELVEDIDEGILMNSFTEWNIDDRRFQSKYVGLEVYLIKDGEVTDTMIRRPVLELTTYGILGSVDAVGKDFFAPLGLCGKGDPMQGVPVSLGGPHVRLRNIRIGGGN